MVELLMGTFTLFYLPYTCVNTHRVPWLDLK